MGAHASALSNSRLYFDVLFCSIQLVRRSGGRSINSGRPSGALDGLALFLIWLVSAHWSDGQLVCPEIEHEFEAADMATIENLPTRTVFKRAVTDLDLAGWTTPRHGV